MPDLAKALTIDGNGDFAEAIMTTDTVKKEVAVEFLLGGSQHAASAACAKGSGMIHPNMATMLCFLTVRCVHRAGAPANCPETSGRRDLQYGQHRRGHLHQRHGFHDGHPAMAGNPTIDHGRTRIMRCLWMASHVVLMNLSRMMARRRRGRDQAARMHGQRRQSIDVSAKTVAKSVIYSSPVQGRHVRRRRQLGPRPLRHRLRRRVTWTLQRSTCPFRSKGGMLAVCEAGCGRGLSARKPPRRSSRTTKSASMVDLNSGERHCHRPGAAT